MSVCLCEILKEAEQYPNVKIEFNQRVVKCDTITGELELENTETHQTQALKVDLIVGCDGAYSAVRQSLLKQKPIDFSQYYISSWYLGNITSSNTNVFLNETTTQKLFYPSRTSHASGQGRRFCHAA